ncbi:hypothetical protein [Tessaracoccus defluvii]|uniref:hypothetical protein n=1 Tax=Tessaracoccus defluvii TaxID=1285901 RepID=UPI001D046E05|nr:hypothetical protein [Tessaracoccus defluvii]
MSRTRILLSADGVSLALLVEDDRLPRVVHWGGDLGVLDAAAFDAVADTGVPLIGGSQPDQPVHWDSWARRVTAPLSDLA